MSIGDKYFESMKKLRKYLWLILIPVGMDMFDLILNEYIYKIKYTPLNRFITLKIGLVDTPPSIRFLLEDFPSPLFSFKNNVITGLLTRVDVFTICLTITIMLLTSYLKGVYLVGLKKVGEEKFDVRELLMIDNRIWGKLFAYDLIITIPILLMLKDRSFILLTFILIFFVYIEYSIVLDNISLLRNFQKGIGFLFDNLGLTIKIAFFSGIIYSLLSIVIYPMARLGNIGVLIDTIIMAYFGIGINKTMMETYLSK
ncbi:hypothetical protein GCM10008905_24730 [Clostridium malenominatum]|uniref:Uncharacterized protein n=1 Tax=Clostridium malenominatum TaxID=1539 RepID=A0ABP3UCG9_9CLOT